MTATVSESLYTIGDHGIGEVRWSTYRDWQYPDVTSKSITVSEAIGCSPHREAFLATVTEFAAKANRHERVDVSWWGNPRIYVGVTDEREAHPYSMRALVSFDPHNGEWASYASPYRYVFARRGWRTFLASVLRCHESYIPLYGEESPENRASREAAAAVFEQYGHHHYEPCAICTAA